MITFVTTLSLIMLSTGVHGISDNDDNNIRRIVTFNTDLFPASCNPYPDRYSDPNKVCLPFEDRRNKITEAISSSLIDTDVVCLQGIYFEHDEEKIIEATKDTYPYTYSFNHDENGKLDDSEAFRPPCKAEEISYLTQVVNCSDHHCHSESNHHKIECMEKECPYLKDLFSMLSDDCVSCITSGTGKNALDCLNATYAFNPTGLLLLSTRPMRSYDREEFPHKREIIRHGLLDVEIEDVGRVICTSMQPFINSEINIDIGDDTETYEKKNLNEAKYLVNITYDSTDVIIAGCINASPSLTKGNIVPQFVQSIERFKQAEFTDPISETYEGDEAHCTVCFGNSYVDQEDKKEHEGGFIFDHIFLKGFKEKEKSIRRVLMHVVEDTAPLGKHFGVSVDVLVGEAPGENE